MNEQDFELLIQSAKQAVAISKGELSPARVFTYEMPDVKIIYKCPSDK